MRGGMNSIDATFSAPYSCMYEFSRQKNQSSFKVANRAVDARVDFGGVACPFGDEFFN